MVSFRVSPFDDEVVEASEKPITLPPRRLTAVSKLRRVRVDGSKKKRRHHFPVKDFVVRMLFEITGRLKQLQNLLFREVVD